MKWQFGRHPKAAPETPIVEAIHNTLQKSIVSKVVERLGALGERGENLHDYGSGILTPFLNYNNRVENYIIDEMSRKSCGPGGYKAVAVELLYGSHSAEVRLTFLDWNNNLIATDVIETQGYEVILDMMTEFDAIVEETGGISKHEGVAWKYSMGV